MLRKRTRSQKDHQMGHFIPDSTSESYINSGVFAQKHKVSSFFNIPALFVGLNPKHSESDSVRSPTSPLEFRVFSTLGNPLRSQRSSEGHQKSWGCGKVGLSIIDALDNETKQPGGSLLIPSKSKNIIFGPQMSSKTPNFESFDAPKSLPGNIPIFPCTETKPFNLHNGSSYVFFGTGEPPLEGVSFGNMRSCSLDSGRTGSHFAGFASRSSNLHSGSFGTESGINPAMSQNVREPSKLSNSSGVNPSSIPAPTPPTGSISTSEIELSEDYTCVRTHGPNPKVTHIFCDCILECHNNGLTDFSKNGDDEIRLSKGGDCCEEHFSYPSSDFLSFCYTCKKKLDGKDIYMYRGEKAFCSSSCRSEEILIDEEKEKTNNDTNDFEKPNNCEKPHESAMIEVLKEDKKYSSDMGNLLLNFLLCFSIFLLVIMTMTH